MGLTEEEGGHCSGVIAGNMPCQWVVFSFDALILFCWCRSYRSFCNRSISWYGECGNLRASSLQIATRTPFLLSCLSLMQFFSECNLEIIDQQCRLSALFTDAKDRGLWQYRSAQRVWPCRVNMSDLAPTSKRALGGGSWVYGWTGILGSLVNHADFMFLWYGCHFLHSKEYYVCIIPLTGFDALLDMFEITSFCFNGFCVQKWEVQEMGWWWVDLCSCAAPYHTASIVRINPDSVSD